MNRLDIRMLALLFFVILPVLCVYFDLYQSGYYFIYSTVCRYWYHIRWKATGITSGGRSYVGDYNMRLIQDLVAVNADRVKEAERIVKNLDVVKGTEEGAWMLEGNGRSQISDDSIAARTDLNDDITGKTTSKIHVALVLISSRRETVSDDRLSFRYQPRYLIQNVASLTTSLSERWKNRATAQVIFNLSICSVSEGDLTAEESYLSRLFTVVRVHQISGTTFGPNHDVMAWAYEKEKRDYIHCLRHSLSIKQVDYAILIEDDAIARPEALDVVEQLVLRRREQRNNCSNIKRSNKQSITNNKDYNATKDNMFSYNNEVNYNAFNKQTTSTIRYLRPPDKDCYYVKLYHPSRLLGYLSLERERIPQLLAIAVVLGSILYYCTFLQRKYCTSDLTHWPTFTNNEHVGVQSSGHLRKGESQSAVVRSRLWRYCRTPCFAIWKPSCWCLCSQFREDISKPSMVISRYNWLQSCLICGLAALLIGRPHMDSAWRRLISPHLHYAVPDVHCCTQAVLYSRQAVLQLGDYLHRVRCNDTWHKDDAIWAWAQGNVKAAEDQSASIHNDYLLNLKDFDSYDSSRDVFDDLGNVPRQEDARVEINSVDGYLIQPNIFKHIGLWSSLRKGFIDPELIRE